MPYKANASTAFATEAGGIACCRSMQFKGKAHAPNRRVILIHHYIYGDVLHEGIIQ